MLKVCFQILITALLLCNTVHAQQVFQYPQLPQFSNTAKGFVPAGWVILHTDSALINPDKYTDIALVIETRDSVLYERSDVYNTDTILYKPRILVIAFYDAAKQRYKLELQHNTFIVNTDNDCLLDPFQEMKAYQPGIELSFQWFYSCGSYGITNARYRFNYMDGEFKLVEAEVLDFHRATHDSNTRHYDFVKGRLTTTEEISPPDNPDTEEVESDVPEEKKIKTVKTTPIKLPELKSLKDFEEPFNWQIGDDYL